MMKAEVGVMCSTTFAVVLSMGMPALADEHAPAKIDVDRAIEARAVDDLGNFRTAQFALPKKAPGEKAPAAAIRKDLLFEYVYGSELEIPYVRNADLDSDLSDDALILAPTIFGSVTYRPTDWLESRLEVTFEKLIKLFEVDPVLLPNGSLQPADPKPYSLLIDQAYLRLKPPSVPVQLTVGRVNFEDHRLWLYDAALDAVVLTLKPGDFQIDLSVSREDLLDLDLFTTVPIGRTDNYFVYTEYRGIEDHKLNAYYFLRDGTSLGDGTQHFMGVRAHGMPSDIFRYWADLGFVRGTDEKARDLLGFGFEVGGTYRFPDLPLQPSVTLGVAYGSGDKDPNDNKNDEYRQTGLQSNEARFGGVTQFVTYGETLDPELTNIQIYTAGLGFRPAPNAFVDLVYHHYRLNEIDPNTSEVFGSAITAQLSGLSKDLGNALDVILGFRNLFGVRGLGVELRAGLFFPGDAFRRDNDGNGILNKADMGISALAVVFY